MMRSSVLILVMLTLTLGGAEAQHARTRLDRDLEAYVMGACLAQSGDAAIKKQGESVAGAVVQRSRGDIQSFAALDKVVRDELARTGVGVAHLDGATPTDIELPVLTCDEMRDRPVVQRAMGLARAKLRGEYGVAR